MIHTRDTGNAFFEMATLGDIFFSVLTKVVNYILRLINKSHFLKSQQRSSYMNKFLGPHVLLQNNQKIGTSTYFLQSKVNRKVV